MNLIYLVTGGAGFLGGNIVSQLINRGDRVRVLALAGDKNIKKLPSEVEVIEGNVLIESDLDQFFQLSPDQQAIVIHSAAIITMSLTMEEKVRSVNVDGARNVVKRCFDPQIRKLIYISSVHAITEKPGDEIITEPEMTDPDAVVGCYAKTKAEACQMVMNQRNHHGLKVNIIFPSGISGPGDYASGNMTQLFIDYFQGRIPMGVHGGYNFVDVRDVARGILSVCDKDLIGEDFILAGQYITVMEILRIFSEISGEKKLLFKAPSWLARLSLPFFSLWYRIRKQTPVFSAYSLLTVLTNSHFSSEKAKRDLGFYARPIEESIRDTARWLKDQKRI